MDLATAVMISLAVVEGGRTLYAWHQLRSPELDQHREIAAVLSLPAELDEAGRHRTVELGIIACVVIAEVALWRFVPNAQVVRWLGHATALASLVLVGAARARAYRKLLAAHERALCLLDAAIAAKSAQDDRLR